MIFILLHNTLLNHNKNSITVCSISHYPQWVSKKCKECFWWMHWYVWTSVFWTASYHLKNIHYLKPFFTQALIAVVHAFFTFHSGYCNSLFYDKSDYIINCLQWILIGAACTRDFQNLDQSISILQNLHWLPVTVYPFPDFTDNV